MKNSTAKQARYWLGAAAFGLLAGCAVVPPSAPTLTALPSQGKSLEQFQQDDYGCRTYAAQLTNQIAANPAMARGGAAGPVLGTAGGAAAGALIGEAAGNAGKGAAIGAGAGLLLGASAGLQQHRREQAALQRQYNNAYAQCITAKGDHIVPPPRPVVVAAAAPVIYAAPPRYYYVPY